MPKSWSQKEIINKLDFIKIKNFCSTKEIVKRMRKQVTDWKQILTKDTIDTRLWSKIYKELLELNYNKQPDWKRGQRS